MYVRGCVWGVGCVNVCVDVCECMCGGVYGGVGGWSVDVCGMIGKHIIIRQMPGTLNTYTIRDLLT